MLKWHVYFAKKVYVFVFFLFATVLHTLSLHLPVSCLFSKNIHCESIARQVGTELSPRRDNFTHARLVSRHLGEEVSITPLCRNVTCAQTWQWFCEMLLASWRDAHSLFKIVTNFSYISVLNEGRYSFNYYHEMSIEFTLKKSHWKHNIMLIP